jgi:subtilase-type serine protease
MANLEPSRHELIGVILFAMMLATIGVPAPALAQCAPAQCADQATLLSPFLSLLSSPEGLAVLNANLQTEESIYLNSTQAQKIASGTVLIVPYLPANVLIRAFPGNPSFHYDAQGQPTAPALPASVAAAVNDVNSNTQFAAMKPYFGTVDVYGGAYGLLPTQFNSVGNPPPYQVSSAILNNPFTPANSSLIAYQNQQTPGAYNVNWLLGNSNIGDFPSAHTMAATFNAIPYAIFAPGYYQQLAGAVADFAYGLNVNGVHYPLDIIGGRIVATYTTAQTLAGN